MQSVHFNEIADFSALDKLGRAEMALRVKLGKALDDDQVCSSLIQHEPAK